MKKNKLALSLVLLSCFGASKSFAAGYSSSLYSTSGLANSYAGSVTGSHDVSDIFFNPAITSDLKARQFVVSVSQLKLNIDPDNVRGNLSSGSAIVGSRVGDAGVDGQIPAFYFGTPINDKTAFGLAISTPFGLATNYDKNWTGRYLALESSIATVNVNPSLSYKLNDNLSVGAGLQAQYYTSTLTKAIFTGGADGLAKVHGSDWGYGYNLGANYKFNDQLKFAVAYRSKIDYKIDGTINASVSGGLRSSFDSKTTTPESLTFGAAFKLNKKVELVYDTTWTRWSRLKTFTVNSNGSDARVNAILNADNTTNFNWHDSFLHSLGANFSLNDKWLLRTGLAYEKDAVSNSNREPRVPAGNKVWTSVGFNYKVSDSMKVDFTYLHQFYKSFTSNLNSVGNLPSFQSRYKLSVDVISVGLRKEF